VSKKKKYLVEYRNVNRRDESQVVVWAETPEAAYELVKNQNAGDPLTEVTITEQ